MNKLFFNAVFAALVAFGGESVHGQSSPAISYVTGENEILPAVQTGQGIVRTFRFENFSKVVISSNPFAIPVCFEYIDDMNGRQLPHTVKIIPAKNFSVLPVVPASEAVFAIYTLRQYRGQVADQTLVIYLHNQQELHDYDPASFQNLVAARP